MVRAKLPGVNTVRKRRADGSMSTYYYHRASGTRLPGNPGEPAFLAAYAEAERGQPRDAGTVAALIREYLLSAKFERRAVSTQREYRRILGKIESRFGSLPIAALAAPRVRSVLADYHEEVGRATPREADNRLTVFSAVLVHAVRRGRIARNPLEGFERLHRADRADLIWTEADIIAFLKDAPQELAHAMLLAILTGQRYGDLIRLRWSDYDGAQIALRQRKTGRRVRVPAVTPLRRLLDTLPRAGPYVLTRPDGRPWFTGRDDKALSKAWTAQMKRAGLYHEDPSRRLQFRDLRGTAVTLLAAHNVEVPLIASLTGHTMQSAHRILERYLCRSAALTEAAMCQLENAPATLLANRLQTGAVERRMPAGKAKEGQ